MAHDEATNKLTLANLMALLRAGTVEKEAEAVEIAKNILETKQPPEQTGAGEALKYYTKLLPLTLIEALNNKKYIALYDKPELNPLERKYNASDYLEELQKLQADIFEAVELLNMHFELTERRKQKAEQEETGKGDLVKSLQTIGKYFVDNVPGFDWELLPYIVAELDKPETAAKFNLNAPFDTTRPEWLELIEAAKAEKIKSQFLPEIVGKKITEHSLIKSKELALPFDIFNKEQNDARDINGQIKLLPVTTDQHIKVDGKIETIQTTSYFSITYSEALPENIAKRLDYFDRLVLGAVDACLKTNGQYMTIRQIGRAMGYQGEIKGEKKEAIINSLIKMSGAWIWYDFTQEQTIYPQSNFSNIGKPHIGENLINLKIRTDFELNGQFVDVVYVLEPELLLYRKAREQNYRVAQIPIECLQIGKMKRTPQNLAIIFHILEQITRNQAKQNIKILYSTLYNKCGLPESGGSQTTINKRGDVKKTLYKYLDILLNNGYIEGYKEENKDKTPGVIITCKQINPLERG